MITKKKIAILLILATVVLAFDSFALTPLAKYTKLLGTGVSTLGMILFIFYYRSYPTHLRRFGVLFILMMITSITASYLIYNQSIASGFIANAPVYLIGTVYFMYFVFIRYKIDIELTKHYLLVLSWCMFFLFLLLFISGFSFVSSSGDNVFGFHTLKKGVINLGAIIYLVYYFKRGKYKYLVFALILFSINHWADFQRYIFFVFIMVIGSLLFIYRNRNVSSKAIAILLFITPILITTLSATKFGEKFAKKVDSVFALFESNDDSETDSSIDSRFVQSAIAYESIKKYPLTGVGRIRSSNKEAVTGGDYFHVSDIGLIGIAYSYGALGIILFFMQFRYVFNAYRRGRFEHSTRNNEFILFAFFLLLHTILTGRSINSPAEFLIMVGLIEIGKHQYSLANNE